MPLRSDIWRLESLVHRATKKPARRLLRFVVAFGMVVGAMLGGCRTTDYTAKTLPQKLRIPPAPASTGINLERMTAATGVGTSQIGPGDLVKITIVSGSGEERSTPMPARVAHDGTVMVPLIGGVPIGGLEPLAAEERIAAAAIERGIYRQPYVTLTVGERAVNRVTVLGAVAKPGVVELPRGFSDLTNALAAAGGLSKEASTRVEVLHRSGMPVLANDSPDSPVAGPDGVRLAAYTDPVRPAATPFAAPGQLGLSGEPINAGMRHDATPQMSRIDLAEVAGLASHNRQLEDRDIVMVVPREKRIIHVTGLVHKPNQFELPHDSDLRVLDAIAMAGGASSPVADKVFIIRQLPDMPEPAVVRVSIAGAKRNGDENLRLTDGDLVSVESTMSTMAVDAVGRFFRIALGINGRVTAF